jgi:16S rRNA (cytosine1402-N4)-methyltransferase
MDTNFTNIRDIREQISENSRITHVSVLQKEILEIFDPKPNQNFIDCTIGEGGHALAILEKTAPEGKILGIDWDQEMIKSLKSKVETLKLSKRLILVNDSFANLKKIVEKENFKDVDGILLDLGLSSWHLEKSGRGFSFQKDEPLDMRYQGRYFLRSYTLPARGETKENLTAEKILNEWPEKEIEKILREYGQERFAKKISKKIFEERKIKPIRTTFQLVEIIKRATPSWYRHKKIHFATRTFQALRIAVNDELENLKKVLPQAIEILKKNGKLVVISFHSLEDRIVKNFFKENSKKGLCKIMTKKPMRPSDEEIKINPRSRSAKLRTIKKL